ncbi:MAG: Maf family protein [Armatimonadota bacterium]
MLTDLTRPLILASASPRRAELLTQIHLPFHVLPSHTEEFPPAAGEDLATWAQQAALVKARATALLLPADEALILAADTVVLLPTQGNLAPLLHGEPVEVVGKPRDRADAHRMLLALSDKTHTVLSAFALLSHPDANFFTDAVETRVTFRNLSLREIDAYIENGEPMDKAGAYGIQGVGAVLIDSIDGDYYTVVGLPLCRLWQALAPWRI